MRSPLTLSGWRCMSRSRVLRWAGLLGTRVTVKVTEAPEQTGSTDSAFRVVAFFTGAFFVGVFFDATFFEDTFFAGDFFFVVFFFDSAMECSATGGAW